MSWMEQHQTSFKLKPFPTLWRRQSFVIVFVQPHFVALRFCHLLYWKPDVGALEKIKVINKWTHECSIKLILGQAWNAVFPQAFC